MAGKRREHGEPVNASQRRRLFSDAILACGLVLLLVHPYAPTSSLRTKALLVAPMGLLWGLAGLIHPPTMLDPTFDLDTVDPDQLRSVAGNWPFWVGLACIPVGLGIGVVLVFFL